MGKLYEESDFDKIIEIKKREAYRVKTFVEMIDQKEKSIVFCSTQLHAIKELGEAGAIRELFVGFQPCLYDQGGVA